MSDTDVLPIPPPVSDTGIATMGAATIMEVGLGSAPARCEEARVFGARGPSDWWFQAKAGDGHLWTFGVRGLGSSPLVTAGSSVSLDLSYRDHLIGISYGPPEGHLQLAGSAGATILWATTSTRAVGDSWIDLVRGGPVCTIPSSVSFCAAGATRNEVRATLNGATVTIPPFGTGEVGGFRVLTGQDVTVLPGNNCGDYYGESFVAAATALP